MGDKMRQKYIETNHTLYGIIEEVIGRTRMFSTYRISIYNYMDDKKIKETIISHTGRMDLTVGARVGIKRSKYMYQIDYNYEIIG